MVPISCLLLIASVIAFCNGAKVLELSDKFSQIRKDGDHWLVMFYAPWCGHCKRLEPIWGHVAQTLTKSHIRVGRIDCTRFPSVATEFKVNGFPTIKLIKREDEHVFNGDRTREDIVNFALRMSGPPVQEIKNPESIQTIRSNNKLFFMHVGAQEGELWDAYYTGAAKLQANGFFYAAAPQVARQYLDIEQTPCVFVYKEGLQYYFYSDYNPNPFGVPNEQALNDTLYAWMNEERFETFPKITRGNINDIMQTQKYIVLAVVEESKLHQISQEMVEFRDMVESVIRAKRDKYHRSFQFGWIGNPELANSIAMSVLPLPHLLVLNSTTNHHHIPEDEPSRLTPEVLDMFLEQIHNQSVPAYGGNGYLVRLYRAYFEARRSLGDMWYGNPVLTTVLFGLPLGFLSLILYSMCCQDILDAEEEDNEPLLNHEKNE